MPLMQLRGARIYYEELGQGPALLLLHSYFATDAFWEPQRAALAADYHLILLDLRGHGRSTFEGGRLRLSDMVSDVIHLIDRLGIEPVHIIGSSLGAQIGLTLAREQPGLARTLTAIAPPHLDEPSCRAYMDQVIHERFPADEERWELPHRLQGNHHARDVLIPNFGRDRDEQPADQLDAVRLADAIHMPVLVMGGDDDPVFPLERALALHGRITGSELCVLPRAGHFPNRTMPGIVNEVLTHFLRRHP